MKTIRATKLMVFTVLAAGAAATAGLAGAQGVVGEPAPNASQAAAIQLSTEAFWTPAAMAAAIPMEPAAVATAVSSTRVAKLATASLTPGFGPGATPAMAQAGATLAAGVDFPFAEGTLFTSEAYGVVPTDPFAGFTGPFQRFGQAGRYLQYPVSTVGKLFFTIPGQGNYVCSATAINRSTYVTAGHCNAGNGVFYTNRMFCPSYVPGGPNPATGCWAGVTSFTTTAWLNQGDPDYDYACVVTATTGTLKATKMGNITGWAGRAWNWNNMLEVSMGYPQAAPFNGNYIHANSAPHWYDIDFRAGGQNSKVMGNDFTGGSSGGPWILGYANGSTGAEIGDVDGRSATDPGFFAVNGVNSHKHCKVNCNSPPTAAAGVFWNEMSSPRFRLDANDTGDSEDVFALCFANANNN